jgi:hypothetical protein
MAYTDSQIKTINEQAKARPGYKYVTNSGKVYVGTTNKRLKQVDNIDIVAVKNDVSIKERLTKVENTKDTIVSVDKKIANTKCYALAIAIAL